MPHSLALPLMVMSPFVAELARIWAFESREIRFRDFTVALEKIPCPETDSALT